MKKKVGERGREGGRGKRKVKVNTVHMTGKEVY